MKQYSLKELLEQSDHIQRICINKMNSRPGSLYMEHHPPLKDENGSWISPNNWNLSDDEIRNILSFDKSLFDYATDVINFSTNEKFPTPWMLPPWTVFPLYAKGDDFWKLGIGGVYMKIYKQFLESLSFAEKDLYFKNYPKPEYFS